MIDVLFVTLPVFAVILLGYGIVRYGPFTRATMHALGDVTLSVTLPLALFHAVAGRDFAEVINLSYLLTLAIAGVATQLVMWVAVGLQGAGPKRRAMSLLGAATPNSALLGYPVFLLVLPEHAAPIVAMNLLIENFLLTPIGLTVLGSAREDDGPRGALWRTAAAAIGSVLRRPLIIGLALAMACVVLGIRVPLVVDRFAGLVGQAAAPVSLIVIGGSLVGLNLRGEISLALLISAVKMIVHPAMIVAVFALLSAAGIAVLSPELRVAIMLTGALPMFAIFVLFGREAGHEGLASLSVAISTCASFVTVNLVLYLLMPQP